MSGLGPTRTYSDIGGTDSGHVRNVSATERLRELLDERGVEWWNDTDPEPQRQTNVWVGGRLIMFHENANGSTGYHIYNTHDLTPEQAIAATLGDSDATATRHGDADVATCAPDDYTAKLMAEVSRLQAKSNGLLKELEAEHALAEMLGLWLDDAKAENAKLRKLVRGLDYCSDELNSAECERCPLYDPADPVLEPKCVRMMLEMGIEGYE